MVKLLFSRSTTIGSALIRFFTWSTYSHVDIVVEDMNLVIGATWPHGVTIKPLDYRLQKASKYEYMVVDADKSAVMEFLGSQLHKPYDLSALFGFLVKRDWQDPEKWFCSELVAEALRHGGALVLRKEVGRVTPQDLYESPMVREL